MQYVHSAKLMRKLRKRSGMPQTTFAVLLGWKSPQYISMIEKGNVAIPIHIMPILSEKTETPIETILRVHMSDLKLKLRRDVGLK